MLFLPLTVVAPEERAVAIVFIEQYAQHLIQTKKHFDQVHFTPYIHSEEIDHRSAGQLGAGLSASTRSEFMKQTGYPKGRKGYVVDHIVPLECGGVDPPSKDQDFSSSAKMSRARSICSFDSGLLGASLRKSRNSRAAPARSPCCRKASPRL
jgi:hypothetical protein